MTQPLPPAQGTQEKSADAPKQVGGVPPTQPRPQAPPQAEKHPRAESNADVDHGPAVSGKRDGMPDPVTPGGVAVPRQVPRTDDKGPDFPAVANIPMGQVSDEGTVIRFDWHPKSVSQMVCLNHEERTVDSIMAKVIRPGTDPGPTSLTFRKIAAGESLTTGKALHTGSVDLVGPANADISGVEQIMAMAPEPDRVLREGDGIAADFNGLMANARGSVTIKLKK